MGIHNEAALSRCSVFEAEMRRRLWWSLVHLDARTSELSDHKASILDPTWDCRIPLNINDSDLRPEMKDPPAAQSKCTEALFMIVRGEIGDFVRHAEFHLDFTNPALKPIAKHLRTNNTSEGDQLTRLESMVEDQYLRFCDQDNPVHFMTIWTTRAHLGKCHLLQHHSIHSSSIGRQTETLRDAATAYAMRTLACDTKIMTSTLTKGFRWMNRFHFPFPAYMQILQDVKRRPTGKFGGEAWDLMSENHAAWFDYYFEGNSPFFQMYAKMVCQAWVAYEGASTPNLKPLKLPGIVSYVRKVMDQKATSGPELSTQQPEIDMDAMIDELSMPMPMNFPAQGMPYNMGLQSGFEMMRPFIYPGQDLLNPAMAPMNQNIPGGLMHGFMRF